MAEGFTDKEKAKKKPYSRKASAWLMPETVTRRILIITASMIDHKRTGVNSRAEADSKHRHFGYRKLSSQPFGGYGSWP